MTQNSSVADSATSINTGNATSAAPNLIMACAAADNTVNPYTSATPTSGTFAPYPVNSNGAIAGWAAYYEFVGPGTYACNFTKTVAGLRLSSAIVLLSFTPNTVVNTRVMSQ